MIYQLDINNSHGIPFRVLVIPAGVSGPNASRAPESGRDYAIVEFYDRRHPGPGLEEEHGQFTGGYYDIRTLLDLPGGYGNGRLGTGGAGLDLHGGVSSWKLDPHTCRVVGAWLGLLYDRWEAGAS